QHQPPADAAELADETEFVPGIGAQTRHGSATRGSGPVSRGVEDRNPVLAGNAARRIAPLCLEQHIAADRRRDSRATAAGRAAMLDDGRANISRRTDRREGDEERVVALLPRDLPNLTGAARALVVANAVDLRSAGLPAHCKTRLQDPRRIGGAALLVDDRVHSVEHESGDARMESEQGEIAGRRAGA